MKKLLLLVLAIALLPLVSATPVLTCEDAIESGLLYSPKWSQYGNATVTNNASVGFDVGLASYQMHDPNVFFNQSLFDSDTAYVGPGQTVYLEVDVPTCQYQIDLVCGPILENFENEIYGDRKIKSGIPLPKNIGYCENEVPEFGVVGGVMAAVAVIGLIVFKRR